MKKIFIMVLLLLFVFVLFIGCKDNQSHTEKSQTKRTELILAEVDREIGLPNLINFQQKRLMKMIIEQCDREDLVCYAYLKAEYTGKLIYIGKCIGYGVPFSAQYTNPEKRIGNGIDGEIATLPQADPNALYMPTSSSATWLMMIDPETNEQRPVYLEPEIVVSPFKIQNAEY